MKQSLNDTISRRQKLYIGQLWRDIHVYGVTLEDWEDYFEWETPDKAVLTEDISRDFAGTLITVLLGIRTMLWEGIDPITSVRRTSCPPDNN